MTIIRYVISITNIWRKGFTLNYINILQPVYFNVFLHGHLLQCKNDKKPSGKQILVLCVQLTLTCNFIISQILLYIEVMLDISYIIS